VPKSNDGFAAVDGDGRLVTRDSQASALEFWDPRTNRPAGRLAAPELGRAITVGWRKGAIQIDRTDDFVELLLDAESWRAHLCQAQNRPFSDAERALLPPGSDREPPCRQAPTFSGPAQSTPLSDARRGLTTAPGGYPRHRRRSPG
jgi:hypothetical protein